MFNNLIESSSHTKEFKRRGSFFVLTTITYGLMLALTGVASIYAYDARLEEQNYEQVITMVPVEPAAPKPRDVADPRPRDNGGRVAIAERAIAMVDVNRPDLKPDTVSVQPNKVLPLPPGLVRITGTDRNPEIPGGGGGDNSGGSRVASQPRIIVTDDLTTPPPLPPQPPAKKIVVSKKVLNSEAISLPKPLYPPLARQIRLQGQVVVQVLIDERGKVISAQAVSGHDLLLVAAKNAALQARFTPTLIGDDPVKVSGVIIYNFVMQ
ncbi:MAG TPA: energy transducer TonB [Pyrinomonadaceae bacterium]|nr:energy transducer TonB [Pyrinomonadaceae bacterium]